MKVVFAWFDPGGEAGVAELVDAGFAGGRGFGYSRGFVELRDEIEWRNFGRKALFAGFFLAIELDHFALGDLRKEGFFAKVVAACDGDAGRIDMDITVGDAEGASDGDLYHAFVWLAALGFVDVAVGHVDADALVEVRFRIGHELNSFEFGVGIVSVGFGRLHGGGDRLGTDHVRE